MSVNGRLEKACGLGLSLVPKATRGWAQVSLPDDEGRVTKCLLSPPLTRGRGPLVTTVTSVSLANPSRKANQPCPASVNHPQTPKEIHGTVSSFQVGVWFLHRDVLRIDSSVMELTHGARWDNKSCNTKRVIKIRTQKAVNCISEVSKPKIQNWKKHCKRRKVFGFADDMFVCPEHL